MTKQITSIEELKNLAADGCDCFILLNHNLRSSKHIRYDKDATRFEILNHIDDTEQVLTEEELMNKDLTNIGYAITKGALYLDY